MAELKSIGSLQLHEDLAHERLEWKLQRIGWALMLLLVLAALSGALGHGGPLSHAAAGGGGLSARYARFERYEAPGEYDITVAPALAVGGRVPLRVERSLLERVEIERFEPEPLATRVDGDALVFEFAATPARPARIRVFYRATRWGALPVQLTVGDARLQFRQIVYP